MGSVVELTDAIFCKEVLEADVPVLVDFWSPTCGPCRMLVPVLEELAEENEGEAKIAKVNVADFPMLGAKFGVDMLPTLLLFHQGAVVERMVGVQTRDKLQDRLDELGPG